MKELIGMALGATIMLTGILIGVNIDEFTESKNKDKENGGEKS